MNKEERSLATPMPTFIRDLRNMIRAGQKTETRRAIHLPKWANDYDVDELATIAFKTYRLRHGKIYRDMPKEGYGIGYVNSCLSSPDAGEQLGCPYGDAWQVKYLREPLKNMDGWAFYADDEMPVSIPGGVLPWLRVNGKPLKRNILPAIHMPRIAARTFVRLTQVVAERLQSIGGPECKAEGIASGRLRHKGTVWIAPRIGTFGTPHLAFRALWDSLNATREGGKYAWKKNPWVWALTFKLEKA